MEKITYASLGALGNEFHTEFEAAVSRLNSKLGQIHPQFGHGKISRTKKIFFTDVNPSDTRIVIGQFPQASSRDIHHAVCLARAAFPTWKATDWHERIRLLRKAANQIAQRQMDWAALLSIEVGKNRFESIAEVSETVDLVLYYCRQMEEHKGYEIPMGGEGHEHTRSILKPYGVWAAISPFNFPMALAVGMITAALITGNTVVFKPASDTPLVGLWIYEMLYAAGLPEGVFNLVTGSGAKIGCELIHHTGIDGLVFTGSKAVGMNLLRQFNRGIRRPCITEMGGKNPAIVMPSAHLEDAAEGVFRSAFGMGSQKCSACSRLYLHRDIGKPFLELLVEKTRKCRIGNAVSRDTFLGPLINSLSIRKYRNAIRIGHKEGRILYGGSVLNRDDFAHGYFVEPTLIDRLPLKSVMFQEEYFAPILAIAEIQSLDEAIILANQSQYGLTAGIFTTEEKEKHLFFEKIEVGVAYCNRRGGATTGAWPGVQSFGGWKGSGSTGKSALGLYYVPQFMREQSQTYVQSS